MSIRLARPDDAAALVALLAELGYPSSEQEVIARMARLAAWPEQQIWLIAQQGEVAGLCHLQGVPLLASDGYAEVMALVVSERFRRQGLARQLLAQAKTWAVSAGYSRLRLRSGVHREDAHVFYLHAGFTRQRASYAFECQPSVPAVANVGRK